MNLVIVKYSLKTNLDVYYGAIENENEIITNTTGENYYRIVEFVMIIIPVLQ